MCPQSLLAYVLIIGIGGILLTQGIYILTGGFGPKGEYDLKRRSTYRAVKGGISALCGAVLIFLFLPAMLGFRLPALAPDLAESLKRLGSGALSIGERLGYWGIAAIVGLLALDYARIRKARQNRIEEWAREHGFKVLSCKGVPGWERTRERSFFNNSVVLSRAPGHAGEDTPSPRLLR